MSNELQAVTGDNLIGPVMDLESARQRLQQFQQFIKEYLVEGEDYGTIPGTQKRTLLKPGADKLCELYGLADDYQVVQRNEDFEKGLFDYEIKCIITSKRGGFLVSTGLGSCNSYEKKYRWRDSKRKCPNCGKETIIKGKDEYGGGWLCWTKNGGCGAKFTDGDPAIEAQTVGKVQNEDVADLKNVILKMAKKRAKIDATLSATRSSGVFTQDVEDWDLSKMAPAQAEPQGTTVEAEKKPESKPEPKKEPAPKAEPKKQAAKTEYAGTPIKPVLFETVLLCEVKEIYERTTKDSKATSYLMLELRVPFGEHQRLFNFHGSLFDALKTSKGQICRFEVSDGARGTLSIENIKSIGETPYKDGKPEQPSEDAPGTQAEETPAAAWQMYAAKGTNIVGVGWMDGVLRLAFAASDGKGHRFYRFPGVAVEDANKLVGSPFPDKLWTQLREKHGYKGEAEGA